MRAFTFSVVGLYLGLSGCSGLIGGDTQTNDAQVAESLTIQSTRLKLLPFAVRLKRVAAVTGVDPSDATLGALRDNRISLGDHDFASGVTPDDDWNAAKLSIWAKSLRPVCSSQAMKTRFAALPDALPQLIEAAYGRSASDDDTQGLADPTLLAGLNADQQYQAICMAVLSSAEFLMR